MLNNTIQFPKIIKNFSNVFNKFEKLVEGGIIGVGISLKSWSMHKNFLR